MLTVLYITMYNVKQSFSYNDTHFKLRELSIDKYTGIWSQLKSNTSAVKNKQKKNHQSKSTASLVSPTVPSAMVTSEKRRSTTEELQF